MHVRYMSSCATSIHCKMITDITWLLASIRMETLNVLYERYKKLTAQNTIKSFKS